MDNNSNALAFLTETAVNRPNIESINLNNIKAKTSRNDEDEICVTISYGKIADGTYSMAEAPPNESLTVQGAVLNILGSINLQKMCTSLESAAGLMDVAYNACNGIDKAHENLYALRNEILDAVGDSISLARNFTKAASSIIGLLMNAYGLMTTEDCDLDDVGFTLARIPKAARGMADMAESLAERFRVLKERTLKAGEDIVVIEGTNLKQQDELEKQLRDFKSMLKAYEATKVDLERRIVQAQQLYDKYDKEATRLNERADTLEIVGMATGVIGAAASAFSGAMSGYNSGNSPSADDGKADKESAGKEATEGGGETAKKDEDKNGASDVKECRDRLNKNKKERDEISKRLEEYKTKIESLENEKSSADKKRSNEEIEKEIADIKKNQEEDSKRFNDLESEISSDETYLNERKAAAIGEGVAEFASAMEEKVGKMGESARSAALAKEMLAEEMLRLKLDLEDKNTEILGKVAEFTQKIKNANIEIIDTMVIINSLQLAITCLSMVGSTLMTVSMFWRSLESTCEDLADSAVIEMLENKLAKNPNDSAAIMKYVSAAAFTRDWFVMESQWQALFIVSNAYFTACNNAHEILDISFNRAEGDRKEHWKKAQEMAAILEGKLNITLRSERSKDATFKKRVELAEKEREKLLAAGFSETEEEG